MNQLKSDQAGAWSFKLEDPTVPLSPPSSRIGEWHSCEGPILTFQTLACCISDSRMKTTNVIDNQPNTSKADRNQQVIGSQELTEQTGAPIPSVRSSCLSASLIDLTESPTVAFSLAPRRPLPFLWNVRPMHRDEARPVSSDEIHPTRPPISVIVAIIVQREMTGEESLLPFRTTTRRHLFRGVAGQRYLYRGALLRSHRAVNKYERRPKNERQRKNKNGTNGRSR